MVQQQQAKTNHMNATPAPFYWIFPDQEAPPHLVKIEVKREHGDEMEIKDAYYNQLTNRFEDLQGNTITGVSCWRFKYTFVE